MTIKPFEQFPVSSNNAPIYQDMGQGAAGRIASWMAWTADPNPMVAFDSTVIMRDETFAPMLDGSSTGATSGGDNAFLMDGDTALLDNFGDPLIDNFGNSILVGPA